MWNSESKYEAILLSTIREKTKEDSYAPQKPSEKSYSKIKHLLLKHFKPKHFMAEFYHFYNAKEKFFYVHIKNFLYLQVNLEHF